MKCSDILSGPIPSSLELGRSRRRTPCQTRAATWRLLAIGPSSRLKGCLPIRGIHTPDPQRPDDVFKGYGSFEIVKLSVENFDCQS